MDTLETRRQAIVSLINEKGNVSFARLKAAFPNVSEMTIRTDLKALDEEKRIVRVHGGAKSVDVVIGTDDLYVKRAVRNIDAKQLIAEKALAEIHPHTTIFLDSGSTTTILAKMIPDQPNIIFTTGLSCAMELAHLTQPEVRLPGGKLNRYSLSVCGYEGIRELGQVNFDTAFIGVTCYSKETGFTCGSADEAELKRAAISRADRTIVLMDSTKPGTRNTFSICQLSDVDAVISDGDLSKEMLAECESCGIEVY